MKKSVADLIKPAQERKHETAPLQRPVNEKLMYSADAKDKDLNKIRSAYFNPNNTVGETFGKPVMPNRVGRQYTHTEKPW